MVLLKVSLLSFSLYAGVSTSFLIEGKVSKVNSDYIYFKNDDHEVFLDRESIEDRPYYLQMKGKNIQIPITSETYKIFLINNSINLSGLDWSLQ